MAPVETESTNEEKECQRSTWEAPTRRTFGSLGGQGLLNVSKMVPKTEAQVHTKLSAQIPRLTSQAPIQCISEQELLLDLAQEV